MKKEKTSLKTLPQIVENLLKGPLERREKFQPALDAIAEAFGAITATLHSTGPEADFLYMVAQRGIPEKLLDITKKIPFGKGMAGLCASRREPVIACNLQTDASGQARPAARETGVAGSIVLPIFSRREASRVIGTLGVGKPGEHAYSEEEQRVLIACTAEMGKALEGFIPLQREE